MKWPSQRSRLQSLKTSEMSGKRILDAAALFNATRAIATRHAALRRRQWQEYTKTSSLSKATKSQTDRVTQTLKAASALTDRLTESASSFSTQAKRDDDRHTREGIQQDHFYKASVENESKNAIPNNDISLKQDAGNSAPLPDGTTNVRRTPEALPDQGTESHSARSETEPSVQPLSANKGSGEQDLKPKESGRSSILDPAASESFPSSSDARLLQRQAERQIPARVAEPPPAEVFETERNQEVFSNRPESVSKILSALPRVKLPRHTGNAQGSDGHVSDNEMNQDVYYSSKIQEGKNMIPRGQAVPVQNELPEGVYSELFHSRKVSKILRSQPKTSEPTKGLELPGMNDISVEKFKKAQAKDQVSFNERPISNIGPSDALSSAGSLEPEEDKTRRLAADITKEMDSSDTDLAKVWCFDSRRKRCTDWLTIAIQTVGLNDHGPEESKSFEMRQSRVPSSRIGRIWQYGGLATSIAFGAVGEGLRRATGSGEAGGSLVLSANNMERLVAKLSRMRGAALKLGQMMSFQGKLPFHKVNACDRLKILCRFEDAT